ncbi:MAG TPA: protein DpdD [Armatimonadota bacterium]|jgi:hypothetical protein
MMMEQAGRIGFLQRFFGPGNDIEWDRLDSYTSPIASPTRAWIDDFRKLGFPMVLPRSAEGRLQWYAVAESARQMRELREELLAFVGPSFSTFRGVPAELDPNDPLESALLQLDLTAYKFRRDPADPQSHRLLRALELMWNVRRTENRRVAAIHIAEGRLLRHFEMALADNNRPAADSALSTIAAQGQLGHLNLAFLEVQLYSTLGLWPEVLDCSRRHDLLNIQRPVAVTRALIQAWYKVELQPFEQQADPQGAVRHFHEHVLPRAPALFETWGRLPAPETVKSFMLLAVGTEPPRLDLRDQLLEAPGLSLPDDGYLRSIAALVQERSPVPFDSLAEARIALGEFNLDGATACALSATPSIDRTRLLLICASTLRSPDVERLAASAVEALANDDLDELLMDATFLEMYQRISASEQAIGVVPEAMPGDWPGWFRRLQRDPTWLRAAEIAQDIAARGVDHTFVLHTKELEELEQLMANADAMNPQFLSALPYLIRCFAAEEEFPRREFGTIYRILLTTLDVVSTDIDTRPPEQYLSLYGTLVDAILQLNVNRGDYRGLVSDIQRLWSVNKAPNAISSILDCLQALTYNTCRDEEARTECVQAVLTDARGYQEQGWLIDEDAAVLRSLAKACGLAEYFRRPDEAALDERAEDSLAVISRLSGTIVLYTLTDGAARSAVDTIRQYNKNCKIRTNRDKVCTASLKALAVGADLFVMATDSAKHPATDCIRDNRPKNLPLLLPDGRGSSSILAKLKEYARSQMELTNAA